MGVAREPTKLKMAATTEKRREVLSDWSAEELEAVVYALEVEEAIPKVCREQDEAYFVLLGQFQRHLQICNFRSMAQAGVPKL